jgi:hypothetical protein
MLVLSDQTVRRGQGDTGPAGTTGQDAISVFGTASFSANASTFGLVPNLSQTINVPSNSVIYLVTDGGVQTNGASAGGFSIVDIALFIDGVELVHGGYRRLSLANTNGLVGVMSAHDFGPGEVGAGSDATVSGDSTSVLQGQLTVMILKK